MALYSKHAIPFLLIVFLINGIAFSQNERPFQGSAISGTVTDSVSNMPIEFANVILFSAEDGKMVTGIASGTDGKFELMQVRPGKYFADFQFLGYEKKRVENIAIGRDNLRNDLGRIMLNPTEITVGAVNVQGKRAPVSYQTDKKVVDVSQMQTVVSGNASDVLQNVPSVTVDADGTVSLRGSTDFTVLVDGRPSVMDAQDVLQQIPATSIETIEIITNPSAKYNPEGTSGIINILLKKAKESGISGITHMNAGLNDKYGADFLIEYKNSNISSTFGADYNRRSFPGSTNRWESFTVDGNTTSNFSNGSTKWGREFWGVRSGIELSYDRKDVFGFNGRFGSRKMNRIVDLNFYKETQSGLSVFRNRGDMIRSGDYFNLNANYMHKFERAGHQLTAQLTFGRNTGDEKSTTESTDAIGILEGKQTTEVGPSDELEGKIEYAIPTGEKSKFEAGYEGEMELTREATGLLEFDTLASSYRSLSQFGHDTKTTENAHSLYTLYSDEFGNFGVQGGVRGEYTYRAIDLVDQNQSFVIDRWDFFPSFHGSYKFDGGEQLMGSYTRRIRRPNGWMLEPFLTWMDASNVRQGNPALKNQYIDSYEFGGQASAGNIFISAEAYYRITHNKIEWVRSPFSENVTLVTFNNVGDDYSLGSEFQISFDPIKSWKVNLMGDVYKYRIEGVLADESFSRESFNWRMRFNNSIRFSDAMQIQINTTYNSPSVSSQGRQESFFTTDLSMRHDLFGKAASLTLQVNNLFRTGKFEFTSEGPGYYSRNYFAREAPTVVLSLKYLFNNFKQEERSQRPDDGTMDQEGF